jgi:hypothetical protein
LSYSVSSALTRDEETGEVVLRTAAERYGRGSPGEIVTNLKRLQDRNFAPKSRDLDLGRDIRTKNGGGLHKGRPSATEKRISKAKIGLLLLRRAA